MEDIDRNDDQSRYPSPIVDFSFFIDIHDNKASMVKSKIESPYKGVKSAFLEH